MLNAPVMEANDAVSGSMAECYVTIDGNRYNMLSRPRRSIRRT